MRISTDLETSKTSISHHQVAAQTIGLPGSDGEYVACSSPPPTQSRTSPAPGSPRRHSAIDQGDPAPLPPLSFLSPPLYHPRTRIAPPCRLPATRHAAWWRSVLAAPTHVGDVKGEGWLKQPPERGACWPAPGGGISPWSPFDEDEQDEYEGCGLWSG